LHYVILIKRYFEIILDSIKARTFKPYQVRGYFLPFFDGFAVFFAGLANVQFYSAQNDELAIIAIELSGNISGA